MVQHLTLYSMMSNSINTVQYLLLLHCFQPTSKIDELETLRMERQKSRKQEDIELRKQQASDLLRDLIHEKPDLPPELPARERSGSRERHKGSMSKQASTKDIKSSRHASPAALRSMRTRTPSPQGHRTRTAGQRPASAGQRPAQRFMSPASRREAADPDLMRVPADTYMNMDMSHDDSRRRWAVPLRSDSSPARIVHSPPGTPARRPGSAEPRLEPQSADADLMSATVTLRPEPKLEEMVRLQRPEVTRSRQMRPKAVPYVQRLAEMNSSSGTTARSTPSTVRSQQRLYGQ